MFDNIFETVNSGFAQALYEDYLRDPASVPAEWRTLFDQGLKGEAPTGNGASAPSAAPASTAPPASAASAGEAIKGPALRLLQNMQASLELPTATSFRDVDVSSLWAHRAALNKALAPKGLKLSFTHLIGWAIVRAAAELPVMTHAVHEEGEAYLRFDPRGVNLGLAVDVEGKDGKRKLMVPVLKGADGMTFAEYHAEYERLVAGARDGKLMPDAYMGGTITLTNPGTIGTVASVPRLMKGQGSIIATGAIREIAGRRLMTITSTYDHRIIQGAESGVFLRRVDALLNGEEGFYEEIADALGAATAGAAAVEAAIDAVIASPAAPAAGPGGAVDETMLYHMAAAMRFVRAYRSHGYLAATLDPLDTPPTGDPALDPSNLDLTPEVMARIPAKALRIYVEGATLAEAYPQLQETYCGTIAYEIEHIARHEERVWLRRVIESGEHRAPLTKDEKRALFDELTKVEGLENFLGRAYLGAKRFGIEGVDMLVPMLHRALDIAAEEGKTHAVLGMAHRGRLNVLSHILSLPYEKLLAEFEGGRKVEETLTPKGGTGDVKYHHGLSGTFRTTRGTDMDVRLLPNPSHLEAVDPVVEGWTRALQTDRSTPTAGHDTSDALPILMHGDAAFAGQGVVAETLNLSKLVGYGTGGTLHIITNNQIGFTTDPSDARSTDFASDLAKGFDIPIVHVNADDPEACIAAVRLAMMYRAQFAGDIVINLVGYRRHGHNEADEPRYTQPSMYALIDEHPTVRMRFGERLVAEGVLTPEDVEEAATQHYERMTKIREVLQKDLTQGNGGEEPQRISAAYIAAGEPDTAVSAEELEELNTQLLAVPDGFRVNKKLHRQLERRREMGKDEPMIDWGHAEGLAFASLVRGGTPIRMAGQDTQRGTFSQRHLVLHDAESGKPYAPIQHLPGATASFEIYNSPLSEYAAMGFEYGYAVAVPEALVIWEAQFGDFANGAEIIIDQFVIAGLSKWGLTSRLTLLLPHGYEGMGPEHSSARLERYLALGAEGNIRVANCSTPAQYFHLLRRQALHQEIRPLIVMTPKSLLRLPQAASRFSDLTGGTFRPVLDDPTLPGAKDDVTRLALCSGKIYYDIVSSDRRAAAKHVAVGRIELLYPFPEDHLEALIDEYPNLEEIVWVQEEPSNMGARKWAVPQLDALAPDDTPVRWISRPERSSPAEGYPKLHQDEQNRLVHETLA